MLAASKTPIRERDWNAYSAVPPPPMGPASRPAAPVQESEPLEVAERLEARVSKAEGYEFDAEMDATELDDRDRPGTTWTARGRRLSRSHVEIRSRRMSYPGRRVLLAVHLVDSEPTPLFGIVRSCQYEGEGLYHITLDFVPVPARAEVKDWIQARGR